MSEASAAVSEVAEFVRGFRLGVAPPDVVAHARLILLDTVGAIASGCSAPEVRALQRRLGAVGGTASSPGTRAGFAPATAAFVNGMAGTWDELDEGNYPTHQHPAIHVVPAALAMAEAHDRDGVALLEALIVGYEVAARTGMATTFRDDVMHPHGTHGILGGAAAVARLLDLTVDQTAEVLRVASSMSVATARGTVFAGATVRNTYAGQTGQHAVLAGDLVLAGVTGQPDGPAAVFGAVSGTSFDAGRFVAGLGTDFVLRRNYFKLHACCAYNHATLEALRRATGGASYAAEDITGVDVTTYFPATRMTGTAVPNPLAAKFSLPYAVSTMLTRGHCDRSAFAWPALSAPGIGELMTRVRIHESPEATRAYPDTQRATVVVRLADGPELHGEVDRVRGDWRAPVPESTLRAKFTALSEWLPNGVTTPLAETLSNIEAHSARTLGGLLRGERP